MSQTPAPQNPRKLPGSKWTARQVENLRKHWEAVDYEEQTGVVTLEAVIDGHEVELDWRDLRDRQQWAPGWE